jgi:hypothetical protein
MSDTTVEQRPANRRADQWAERIAAQLRAGISVKQFCKEQGLTEYSFYGWRKRLQQSGPVRFAFVDRSPRGRRARWRRRWNLCWRAASGCASAPAWTPDPADRAGRVVGMIHLPASVRRSAVERIGDQSWRSASAGSTDEAVRAGRYELAKPTRHRTAIATA